MYMDAVYCIVLKCRFTQFESSPGFFAKLHVYFKKSVQKLPELAVKMGAAVSQHYAIIFPNGIRSKYNNIITVLTALDS